MKSWTIEAIKNETLNWLRERFEIPDAEWVEGMPRSPIRCPIAEILTRAGYENVWVGRSLIKYGQNHQCTRVRLPLRVSLFPKLFDEGRIPELVLPVCRQLFLEVVSYENKQQSVASLQITNG